MTCAPGGAWGADSATKKGKEAEAEGGGDAAHDAAVAASLGFALAAYCAAPGEGKAAFRLCDALAAQGSAVAASFVAGRALQGAWAGAEAAAARAQKAGAERNTGELIDLVEAVAGWGATRGGLGVLLDAAQPDGASSDSLRAEVGPGG